MHTLILHKLLLTMRLHTLSKLKEVSDKSTKQVEQYKQFQQPTRQSQVICKHKYWTKVSKRNKLQLLMDYINRTYSDDILKTTYCFKITVLLNNGDLNNDNCVEFDYINNCITKLNFSLDDLSNC